MKTYHHIVLFRLHDGVDDETRQQALEKLRDLGRDMPGLQAWSVQESIDSRKGYIIIEVAKFESRVAFEQFRDSTHHAEVSAFISDIADWWVGDYEV